MNKELFNKVLEVGKQWVSGDKKYSFEIRMFVPLSKNQNPEGGFVAIIDVQGFYRDDKWTDAIKLHSECVFSKPDLLNPNLAEEQISNYVLSKKLENFTLNSYENFNDILNKEKATCGKIYSSDPFYC